MSVYLSTTLLPVTNDGSLNNKDLWKSLKEMARVQLDALAPIRHETHFMGIEVSKMTTEQQRLFHKMEDANNLASIIKRVALAIILTGAVIAIVGHIIACPFVAIPVGAGISYAGVSIMMGGGPLTFLASDLAGCAIAHKAQNELVSSLALNLL